MKLRYGFIGFVVSFVLMIGSSAAQEAQSPASMPTLRALESAVIPPRDRVVLGQRLLGVGEIAPPPATPPNYQPGDRKMFRASNSFENIEFEVTAELQGVGEHIYLWQEVGGEIDPAQLQVLAQRFDEYIYPEVRALWGSEATPGVDGDPRVYGLFARNLGEGTAAYFASSHIYPTEVVATSNAHEMFFFNLDVLGSDFNLEEVESIVAHEFQHMIRANVQINEDYWLNEGFSEFTQMHLYDLQRWEMSTFLAVPSTQVNTWAADFEHRAKHYGASLLLTTYFADRYGLDALRQLSDDPSSRGLIALDNVLTGLGEPGVDEFFADWVAANWLFDSSIADGRYGYRSVEAGRISAAPLVTVNSYPYTLEHTVSQYATNYIELLALDGASALDITLEIPEQAALVPTTPTSGERMWYSNRADMSNPRLTRAFDLTGVNTATLEFALWYDIEPFWDFGYVMVSTDGGATWSTLATDHTTTENPHGTAYGAGYTGTSGGGESAAWVTETISLDAYVGGEILLSFEMISDDAITGTGMLIDDVRVDALGYASDFEGDGGGWTAEGWVWIDNRLPQEVWLQTIQETGETVVVNRWRNPQSETLTLNGTPDRVTLAISPFAPQTTVPADYTLTVTPR